MLKLKKYSFSGIGRFVEKQTIDLENRDHLIQIDGENLNTGGSSGAGKSTTVEALAYLLGISEIASTQLQSRITKKPIWVQGEFEGGIVITRSKKDGLSIQTPETSVSGSNKLAEEELDRIIGVNRDLLKRMCYKRQKQGGFFLNLTPKQSHEFLIQCLDLKDFQSKIYKLEDLLKNKYKPKKIELESAISVLQESVLNLQNLLEQKKEPQEPVLGSPEDLEASIEVSRQRLEGVESKYQEMLGKIGPKPEEPVVEGFTKQSDLDQKEEDLKQLKAIILQNQSQKQESIDQARFALQKIEAKIQECLGYKEKVVDSQGKLEELLEKKKHSSEGNCPTCLRKWKTQQNANILENINQRIKVLEDSVDFSRKELEKIPHYKVLEEKAKESLSLRINKEINTEEENKLELLQEEIRILKNEKENLVSVKRKEYLEVLNSWNKKFNTVNEMYKKEEFEIKNLINKNLSEIKNINIQKQAYKDAVESFRLDVKNIEDKKNKSLKDLEDKKQELNKIEKETLLSEESIRLIKNFTLQKFQDTLDYIGIRATEIINNVPNMSNAVISFENAKETKSGKIKNEVNAVLNLEGDAKIPIKTLSGGERTSADFAVDLAVSEMIENMTQKGVNFLIIDEGFDGLDSISKIECLEILKSLNTNKKIMIVDHSSEVKEMVYDIIKVKRINEESFIQ